MAKNSGLVFQPLYHSAMRPRLRILASSGPQRASRSSRHTRHYASVAATAPSPPPLDPSFNTASPIERFHPTQPPSYKPPEFRKSQLVRQYTALLQSSPLLLIFQHNNLIAQEWAALRRELKIALDGITPQGSPSLSEGARLMVIQTRLFGTALRLVEFYKPPEAPQTSSVHATEQHDHVASHYLSQSAYDSVVVSKRRHIKKSTPLHNLLRGPVAVVSFPDASPDQVAAVLSILSPTTGSRSAFPPPKRKTNPSYYDATVQTALRKIFLLGARVEEGTDAGVTRNRTLDGEGVQWLGGLKGGLDGLRAQLVNTLQSAGMGLTSTLEGAGRSLWVTMEGRRMALDEEEKPSESK